jgi:hypothetical protein
LHVRERKADHTTAYPLAPVIGEAIIDYLKNGRPDVPSRVLFWRHLAPRAPLTHAAVSSVASKYLHKAGIRYPGPDPIRCDMPAFSDWSIVAFRSRPSATTSGIGPLRPR